MLGIGNEQEISCMYTVKQYTPKLKNDIINFLEKVLPESGRKLDLEGRHCFLMHITDVYDKFWCLYDGEHLIGTVGIKRITEQKCELKTLYLYCRYHGQGLGYQLLSTAIGYAKEAGYLEMYLDTLSTSKRAIHLYEAVGFTLTDRYNDNFMSEIFMRLELV